MWPFGRKREKSQVEEHRADWGKYAEYLLDRELSKKATEAVECVLDEHGVTVERMSDEIRPVVEAWLRERGLIE